MPHKHKSHKKERREKKKKHKERSSRESGDDVRVWLKLRFDGEYVLRRCLTGTLCSGVCLQAKTETSSPLPHPATALPAPEPNLQNVTPNLIQSAHTSSIISSASSSSASSSSSSGKHQQQQQHHHHQVSK